MQGQKEVYYCSKIEYLTSRFTIQGGLYGSESLVPTSLLMTKLLHGNANQNDSSLRSRNLMQNLFSFILRMKCKIETT